MQNCLLSKAEKQVELVSHKGKIKLLRHSRNRDKTVKNNKRQREVAFLLYAAINS